MLAGQTRCGQKSQGISISAGMAPGNRIDDSIGTIEKPLEMPYWNILCLRRICLFVYVCSVTKNKITKPYARKFDGFLVNDDKIVN